MASELRFHPRVKTDLKHLSPEFAQQIRQKHLRAIQESPAGNPLLSGNLKGIYSYHLHHRRNQYRIAYLYTPSTDTVTVLMIAKRENFYDLLRQRTR